MAPQRPPRRAARRLRAVSAALRRPAAAPAPTATSVDDGAAPSRSLRLGAFDLVSWRESSLPSIAERYGAGFFEVWEQLFEQARASSTSVDLGGVALRSVELVRFSPVEGHYPSAAELASLDGIVISGSGEDSWSDTPWLVELRARLADYDAQQVRMSGFSFGPQVLAAALGGRVARNPLGHETTVTTTHLSDEAREYFGTPRRSVDLIVHHNDAVLELPPGAKSLGGSAVTEHHGWFRGANVLAFAHHPEYCFVRYTATHAFLPRPAVRCAGWGR